MNRRQFMGMVAALSATSLISKEVNGWAEQAILDDLHSNADLVLAFKGLDGRIIAMGVIECSNPASKGVITVDDADFYAVESGIATTAEIVNGDYVVSKIPISRGSVPIDSNHGIYMDQIHLNTGDRIELTNFTMRV